MRTRIETNKHDIIPRFPVSRLCRWFMSLSPVREPSDEERLSGKVCQECCHWKRIVNSYGEGSCHLPSEHHEARPRPSYESNTCDEFKRKT